MISPSPGGRRQGEALTDGGRHRLISENSVGADAHIGPQAHGKKIVRLLLSLCQRTLRAMRASPPTIRMDEPHFMGRLFSSPSSARISHKHAPFAEKQKSPCSPYRGNKDRTDKFCGTTLFAVCENDRSVRCQHTACHITPALRQRILRKALSPCPRRPICRSAFRPALSSAGLSVDALSALLPLLRFALLNLESLYIRNVRLSRTFFHEGENNFNTPVQRLSQGPESGRGCRQWGNSSRFRA